MRHIFFIALFMGGALEAISVINGSGNLENQTVDSLIINGSGTIKSSKVTGKLDVNGAVSIMDSHFQEMSINGSFMANNINVTGDVSVQGSFLAKNSNFKNIEVTSEKITLDNCSAGEIKVNNSSDQDQIVEVKGKSRIQKITFVSNRGIVKKNSESTVEVVSGEKLQ